MFLRLKSLRSLVGTHSCWMLGEPMVSINPLIPGSKDFIVSHQARFQILAEAIPHLVWMTDSQGKINYLNQRWADYFGVALEDHRSETIMKNIHPDDIDAVRRTWLFAYENSGVIEGEFRLRKQDGQYRWHLNRALPLKDVDGRILNWFGTCTDIQDQKAAQQRQLFLVEASDLLTSTLDYHKTINRLTELVVPQIADWCSVHIIDHTSELRLLSVQARNPELNEMGKTLDSVYSHRLGVGAYKVVKTLVPEMVSDITSQMIDAHIVDDEHGRLLQRLNLRSYLCVPMIVRDEVLGALTMLMTESGRLFGEADFRLAQDLARRAAVAIDNARLYRDAQIASRSKDEFLATLSHELRTPINVIQGWVDLLQNEPMDQINYEEALKTLDRNIKLQARLINDLLDVSRIIAGKMSLQFQPVGVAPIIDETVASYSLIAHEKKIKLLFEKKVQDDCMLMAHGDGTRIDQVLRNLLSNALKFTPAGGTVCVRLWCDEKTIFLQVEDSGYGIDPRFQPFVFEAFRQEDSSTTRNHGGLGLGLAIVKHIVEAHKGKVEVASKGKNRGAAFTVTLPRIFGSSALSKGIAGEEEHSKHSKTDGHTQVLSGVRVLVIDDAEDVLSLLELWLKKHGADVIAANSAFEALKILDNGAEPNVILSDIGMPGLDGYGFIRRVRARSSQLGGKTPAAALTAYATEEEAKKAVAAGFQVHLAKPISSWAVVQAVEKLARGDFRA